LVAVLGQADLLLLQMVAQAVAVEIITIKEAVALKVVLVETQCRTLAAVAVALVE
jgi:hypothetical protein